MKYITEAQLRDLYKESPFKTYKCSDDTRLTPNARQFLIDFKIEILDFEDRANKKLLGSEKNLNNKPDKKALDDFTRIGLTLRKLAVKLKGLEPLISYDLFNLSKDLKNCKFKDLEILEDAKAKAEKIFMNMEISNPYLDLFIIIDDFAGDLSRIELCEEDEKIVNHLVVYTYSLFIKRVKGAKDN